MLSRDAKRAHHILCAIDFSLPFDPGRLQSSSDVTDGCVEGGEQSPALTRLRQRHSTLAAKLIVLSLLGTTRTWAVSPASEWDVPVGCPSAEEARRAVAQLVDSGAHVQPVDVTVRIRRVDLSWVGEFRSGNRTRTLEGKTCREVVDGAVVIWALAIGSRHVASERTDEGKPEELGVRGDVDSRPPVGPASPAMRARRASSPVNDSSTIPVSTPLQAGAAVRLLGDSGTLSVPSVGLAARGRFGWPRAFSELSLLGLLPRSLGMRDAPNRGAAVHWFAGQISACAPLSRDSAPVGCLGAEVGRVSGTGFGVDHPETAHALWIAPVATLTHPLVSTRSLRLEAAVSLAIPLLKPAFALDHRSTVYQAPTASVRLEMGIGWY